MGSHPAGCDEPVYRVYSESVSQEAAQELASFYVDKIRQLVHKEPGATIPPFRVLSGGKGPGTIPGTFAVKI